MSTTIKVCPVCAVSWYADKPEKHMMTCPAVLRPVGHKVTTPREALDDAGYGPETINRVLTALAPFFQQWEPIEICTTKGQAAADLANAPTRDELAYAVWLFTHPKTTIKQFYKATANQKGSAYRRADALLKAGVRVRG